MRLIGIIAIAAIIGFTMAACGDDDDKLPPAGDGSISSFPLTGDVYIYDHIDDFKKYNGSEIDLSYVFLHEEDEDGYYDHYLVQLSDFGTGTWEVKVTNSGLSLRLGTPSNEHLENASLSPFSATGGLALFGAIQYFLDSNDDYQLTWRNPYANASIGFVYANKNGNVSGKYQEYCEFCEIYHIIIINWDLKQGWNTVIGAETWSENSDTLTLVTGKPGNNFLWILRDYSSYYNQVLPNMAISSTNTTTADNVQSKKCEIRRRFLFKN